MLPDLEDDANFSMMVLRFTIDDFHGHPIIGVVGFHFRVPEVNDFWCSDNRVLSFMPDSPMYLDPQSAQSIC